MNTRLFLAGALVLLAGLDSDYRRAWVVAVFGLAMIAASILPAILARSAAPGAPNAAIRAQVGQRERIVRESRRETRERYWPFDRR
ncbi:membrane protein [Mycobacterium phage Quesadilla]|uniref:Membrane protein n=1 Tax=Mycobacterium phage Quesadilla TaxID=2664226 RepID=A0A5Q2WF22_9CAUD|nr:membrane protein [Mycobacterium phage Quesadilla]QGH75293.1 membrane protein [Mycobacterium phage Quesadilla]